MRRHWGTTAGCGSYTCLPVLWARSRETGTDRHAWSKGHGLCFNWIWPMHACMKQSVCRSCYIISLVFFLEWNVISTPFGVRVVISLPYDDMDKLNNNNWSLCLCWAQRPCFGVGFCLIAYSCCDAMFPCSSSTSRKAHVSSMTIVSMLVVNH